MGVREKGWNCFLSEPKVGPTMSLCWVTCEVGRIPLREGQGRWRELTMPRAANRIEVTPAHVSAARHAVRRGEQDVARACVAATSLEHRLEMLMHGFAQGLRLPRRSDRQRAAESEVAAIPGRLEAATAAKARVQTELLELRKELQVAEDRWAMEQNRARNDAIFPGQYEGPRVLS